MYTIRLLSQHCSSYHLPGVVVNGWQLMLPQPGAYVMKGEAGPTSPQDEEEDIDYQYGCK